MVGNSNEQSTYRNFGKLKYYALNIMHTINRERTSRSKKNSSAKNFYRMKNVTYDLVWCQISKTYIYNVIKWVHGINKAYQISCRKARSDFSEVWSHTFLQSLSTNGERVLDLVKIVKIREGQISHIPLWLVLQKLHPSCASLWFM